MAELYKSTGDSAFVREEGTEACIPLARYYILFPTIAADNPKFMPAGYWRGPIWLDQVFTRLQGLSDDALIHENYDTKI